MLSPNEEIKIISARIDSVMHRRNEIQGFLNDLDIDIQLCYCSVYDKCWNLDMSGVGQGDGGCDVRSEIK